MAHTDPIADMLTRIRNASSAKNSSVLIPHSRMKESIIRILKTEGYVRDVEVIAVGASNRKMINVVLKYHGEKPRPVIKVLTRVSKPGCRVYSAHRDLPRVQNGLGLAILSTSRGIITDKTARAQGIGGEYICRVW